MKSEKEIREQMKRTREVYRVLNEKTAAMGTTGKVLFSTFISRLAGSIEAMEWLLGENNKFPAGVMLTEKLVVDGILSGKDVSAFEKVGELLKDGNVTDMVIERIEEALRNK